MKRRQKFRQRCQHIWSPVKAWMINYGFAGLVLLAFAGGVIVAQQTEVPPAGELPGLAFGSQALYRNEVGGVSFVFYYVVVLLFVMALNGRGMTQIGPKGVRDGKVVNKETQGTIKGQEKSIKALQRDLAGSIEVGRQLGLTAEEQAQQIVALEQDVAKLQQRIADLEKQS